MIIYLFAMALYLFGMTLLKLHIKVEVCLPGGDGFLVAAGAQYQDTTLVPRPWFYEE